MSLIESLNPTPGFRVVCAKCGQVPQTDVGFVCTLVRARNGKAVPWHLCGNCCVVVTQLSHHPVHGALRASHRCASLKTVVQRLRQRDKEQTQAAELVQQVVQLQQRVRELEQQQQLRTAPPAAWAPATTTANPGTATTTWPF